MPIVRPRRTCARLVVSAGALLAIAVIAALTACGGGAPPPRTPFGTDTATPTAATSTATASPAASASPTATAATPGVPVAVDRELAIGKAIERMAQWLGVEQTDVVFASFAEDTFSNACLGVARPAIACAEVVTPGVRVSLLDRTSAGHEVRADAALQSFAWAPAAMANGRITAIDQAVGTLSLDAAGTTLRLRRAPGTLQDTPFDELAAGDQVTIGFDHASS
ncbi:MAG: hypothetical protein O2843_11410, partial [Chloroflexi bacterium]|nr:hypothetical protein [Chloroflexota bacterium]